MIDRRIADQTQLTVIRLKITVISQHLAIITANLFTDQLLLQYYHNIKVINTVERITDQAQ